MSGEFIECAACAAKPPTLCAACVHNRLAIAMLSRRLELADQRATELMADLAYERGLLEDLDKSLKEGTHEVSCLESRFTTLRARIAYGRPARVG